MHRLAPVALILAALPGCSGDPASSRLKIGNEAIVRSSEPDPKRPSVPSSVDGAGETIPADIVHDDAVRMKPQSTITTNILVGSKVRVIADDQSPDIRGAKKDFAAYTVFREGFDTRPVTPRPTGSVATRHDAASH